MLPYQVAVIEQFSDSPELGAHMCSFKLERPPQWNLSLVLKALLKSPFEPLQKI